MKTRSKPERMPVPQKKKISVRNLIIIIAVAVVAFILIKSFAYKGGANNSEINSQDNPEVAEGKSLAAQYCQSCHMLPDPALLNKEYWGIILPQMGLKLGIKSHRGINYSSSDAKLADEERRLNPGQPALDESKWQKILDYYNESSPSALPLQNRSLPISRELPFFSVSNAPEILFRPHQMVSYVKIDNSVKPARLFVFEKYSNQLFLLNNRLQILDSVRIDGSIVDINFYQGQIMACSIGKRVNVIYDDEDFGKVFPITVSSSGKMQIRAPLFKDLHRPIQVTATDLNGDHLTDYILCEFGKTTGALSWMENQGGGRYKRHIIRNAPGSVKVIVKDIKHNGQPDLWVLFAQGEEGIFHFKNKGKGDFEEKEVLRFPPVYGSTSFEMTDMNKDGTDDIIYTCGDNGDKTGIFKPYHGVYIFTNDGKENFKQQYFFPVNGCYRVIARDFSNTGKIDLALNALFIDPRQPEEGFIYLKNEGDLRFSPYSLPQGTKFECTLTMDSGDFDGDGKPDLLLGNAFENNGPFGYNKMEPMFLALKNLGK